MAIYKTRWFDRWARKQRLSQLSLYVAVQEMKKSTILEAVHETAKGLYQAGVGSSHIA
jgi:hypothetical protein